VGIERYRVDFLWPRQRVIAEAAGAAAHRGERARVRHARRDRHLTDLGYEVLRLSYA
jgi:very-short-patch-repair endonuclease